MISQEDYNAMQETLYLLSTPNNANRLRESVARIKAGTFEVKEPFLDEQETN
ncbi:prevent-host-death family protein [Rheinheimera nanhaiensis E407-8]|uniref:Antitoxin n=2 Tax=Rheinheimera TaxID=67575 RepID=I1DY33_9GAMM|nr:prevent-host-death family protein [Rheinheimera nanhaiensis E407-8]